MSSPRLASARERFTQLQREYEGPSGIRARKIIAGLVIVFFSLYLGVYILARDSNIAFGQSDFTVFYVAGASITGTMDITPPQLYDKQLSDNVRSLRKIKGGLRYLYLPQAALFFAPFSFIDFKYVYKIWSILNSLTYVGLFYLGIRFFDKKWYRLRYSTILFLLAFSSVAYITVKTGQINSLTGLLILAGFWYLQQSKQGISGAHLAIAATLKVFPVIFAPYLLLRKKWKSVASMVGWSVGIFLFSVPFFGVSSYLRFFQEVLMRLLLEGNVGRLIMNGSLYGTFLRTMQERAGMYGDISLDQITIWGDRAYFLIAGIGIAAVGYALFRHRNEETKITYLLDYGLIIVFFLLFTKGMHEQFTVWTLPLLLLFFRRPLKLRTVGIWIVGAVFLFATQFWKTEYPEPGEFLSVVHPSTIALCCLFILLLARNSRLSSYFFQGKSMIEKKPRKDSDGRDKPPHKT